MPQSRPDPRVFLLAHDVCKFLLQNRAIHFQIDGLNMDRATAQRHFKEREALVIVQTLLLDASEEVPRGQ
jgi:hypothetical protein